MLSDSTALVMLLLFVFGVGMLAGLLGRGRWSTVVIQTPVHPQPEPSLASIALAILFLIAVWLYFSAVLG